MKAERSAQTDVAVVGAGAAGLYAALRAAEAGARVALVSRKRLAETVSESASYWAQGGLAAALGPDDSPRRHAQDTLQAGRNLTWWSCFNLVISRVIGSGIFATPGAILQAVGSPGLTLLLWIVGAVIAACGLAVSLEFGCMLPRSGADKVYLEFTYRKPRFLASTMVAMSAVFLGFTASNCVMFTRVCSALGLDDAGALLRKGLALALLVVVTVTHVVFPKAGYRFRIFRACSRSPSLD